MKRLLLFLFLFSTTPAFSQERARRLWLSGEIAYAAAAPVARTERPFGNLLLGVALEQELPCRLALVTGYGTQNFNACIPRSDLRTRTSWEYDGIGYSRAYAIVPLHLRWQVPIVSWNSKKTIQPGINRFYVTPHAGVDFGIGREGWFFGEAAVPQQAVKMHRRPDDFFTSGEVGLSLGVEMMGLIRLEVFTACTFHPGRLMDFSLGDPYTAPRTYSKYDTFQAGCRVGLCLIDWKRTAAERAAAEARRAAFKQWKRERR